MEVTDMANGTCDCSGANQSAFVPKTFESEGYCEGAFDAGFIDCGNGQGTFTWSLSCAEDCSWTLIGGWSADRDGIGDDTSMFIFETGSCLSSLQACLDGLAASITGGLAPDPFGRCGTSGATMTMTPSA